VPSCRQSRTGGATRAIVARAARWNPVTVAAVTVVVGLLAHEVAYHLAGGDDFPLVVLANGHRVFMLSHGALDALGVAALVLSALALLDAARIHERRLR
jgi:hypothetical protein